MLPMVFLWYAFLYSLWVRSVELLSSVFDDFMTMDTMEDLPAIFFLVHPTWRYYTM